MFVFMVFKINFIVWPIIPGLVLYIKDLQTSHLKLVCRFEQSLFPPHGYFVIQKKQNLYTHSNTRNSFQSMCMHGQIKKSHA